MDKKITVINIIIQDKSEIAKVNEVLSAFAANVIGRMGLPYPSKGVNIISLVMDAPAAEVSELAGKLSEINGTTINTLTTDI